MSNPHTPELVTMTGITKRFGPVVACDGAEFAARQGAVTAVVGANGAGKSTLVGILCGVVRADSGAITFEGRPARIRSVQDAARRGIALVAQRPLVVGELTGLENCALSLGGPAGPRLREALESTARRFGFDAPLDCRMDHASPAQRQRLDVLRMLARDPRVMVFDEPTSALSPDAADRLLAAMRRLAEAGKTVVLVSHKLGEVLRVADSIYCMSGGRTVAKMASSDTSADELARLIAGDQVAEHAAAVKVSVPAGGLDVNRLCAGDGRTGVSLRDISFQAARGEIFGVAGVAGNGQTELADVLAGLLRPSAGEISFDGAPVVPCGKRFDWVAYVPEDVDGRGLAIEMSLAENLLLGCARRRGMRWRLSPARLKRLADEAMGGFGIVGVAEAPVRTLSGGNRMKALLAREFARRAPLMVAVSPAAGLDVRAAAHFAEHLMNARERGATVILISYDLDQIFQLADRVGALARGKLVGPWTTRETSARVVTRAMITGTVAQ